MVAREKAEAAYLAARGQPASVLVPLWEAWSAAQKACINNKPQLKGSAKEIPHPLGKQREGAGTNTTPKPGGQGCSPAALARMCYEVERGTKNWKMGEVGARRQLHSSKPLPNGVAASYLSPGMHARPP